MIPGEYVIWIVLVTVFISVLLSGFYFSKRILRKVMYMLDALEDKEMNFRFDEKSLFSRALHRTLNRIRLIFEKERQEISEQERYYGQMLDCVNTGIVVVDLNERAKGRVLYNNKAATNILGISSLSNIRQLANVSSELESCFDTVSEGNNEMKVSFYNEKGQISLSVVATLASLQGKDVKIIVLNDISNEMSHNEEISWNKLIRVLTHEIMNTVTPIASLSRTLSQGLDSKADDCPFDRNNLKLGLETIAESSNGLIKFVDTYRSLTRISTPVKKAFYLKELVDRVRQLTSKQINDVGATLLYVEKSDDILLYADEDQISQVFVNLIKNALQAHAMLIEITAEIDFAETVVIQVSNNGKPINKENYDDIFVPFYTTKQEGTGVGLSLSRQIMRLHNGKISLVCSNEKNTVFKLQFK